MSNPKFPGLADSGYPDHYDVFNQEMEAMWDVVVPEERRAPLAKFGRYISGEEISESFANELPAATRQQGKTMSIVEVDSLGTPAGNVLLRSVQALKSKLFNK